MAESTIQTKIIKYLEETLGWKVINTIVLSKSGEADLICCDTRGMFWAIEVKDLNKKPRPLQTNKLIEVQELGGHACSVDSLDQLKSYISKGVPHIENKKIIFSL